MKIRFVSLGHGAGHLMRGIAIHNAIQRKGLQADYRMVGVNRVHPSITASCPFEAVEIVPSRFETEPCETTLYKRLTEEALDLVIVDHAWAWTRKILRDMDCCKILLLRQISAAFLRLRFENRVIEYTPDIFDQVYLIEPFKSPVKGRRIPPVVVRNPDEILSREAARSRLRVPDNRPCAVIAHVGSSSNEMAAVNRLFDSLPEKERYYRMACSGYADNPVFPLSDYYNGIDLMVCGAGYNTFWETRYFNKKAVYLPFRRAEEDQRLRIRDCAGYQMRENGADVLVQELFN